MRGAIRVWGIAVIIRERNNYRPVVIHFDTVTGRDSAEKPVTLSDVTVTVPIPPSLLIPSGSWALSFSFTHMPWSSSSPGSCRVWSQSKHRLFYCNALQVSCLPSLFYLFSDTSRTTTALMQLNMIFATPKILPSKTIYQFHMVSGAQFVILRFQVLIVWL